MCNCELLICYGCFSVVVFRDLVDKLTYMLICLCVLIIKVVMVGRELVESSNNV